MLFPQAHDHPKEQHSTLSPSHDSSTSAHDTEYEIERIEFSGNTSLPASRLKEVMDLRERSILHPFRRAPFHEELLQDDLKRVERLYQSEGFYDATVKGTPTYSPHRKTVSLTISVHEGEPTIVTAIMLKVTNGQEDRWHDTLIKLIPLKEGSRFRTDDYKTSEKVILQRLAEDGYPNAKVEMSARVFKRERKAFVWIDVEVGKRCTIGDITVVGTEDEREVRRLLTFNKGELFRTSNIRKSQKRLWDSQLFSYVDIAFQKVEDDAEEIPIVVTVREAKPYTVKAGIGYGTEDQLRGKLEFEARRFLGNARRMQLQAKASAITQQAEAKFIQPHAIRDDWWLDIRAGIGHDDEKSYETETFYLTPQLNIPINEMWRLFIGYAMESNHITDIAVSPYDPTLEDRKKDSYFISSLVSGFSMEQVDDPLNPRKGFRLSNTTEWALESLGSETSYLKTDFEIRAYIPLFSTLVIGNRFRWGMISNLATGSTIPIFKRFFSGGSNSVRGYPYHKLGPLDPWGNALGGKSVIEGNVDLRFPLERFMHDLEGVIFFDIGQVAPTETAVLFRHLRYAVGTGVRYNTPVGPLRLDVGYARNPPEESTFYPLQVYFSIGQAF